MEKQNKIFINRTNIEVIPTTLIGCGGKGTEAVEHCRNLAQQELFDGNLNSLYEFNPLLFLAIDSEKQDIETQGIHHNIYTIPIASSLIETIIEDENFPSTGSGPIAIRKKMPKRDYKRMLNTLPSTTMGNSTCPPLGSMNFLGSWNETRAALKAKLQSWKKPYNGSFDMKKVTSMQKQNQIFIVSSLYGGTGSGIHIHLAALLRALLQDQDLQIENTAIYGIFFLPDIVKNADHAGRRKLKANAYACLKELDYFLTGNPYTLELGTGTLEISNKGTDYLFNRIFLINDRNQEKVDLSANEIVKMTGEFLFHFSGTSLGQNISARLMDDPRDRCQVMAPEKKGREYGLEKRICAYSTFGLATTRIPYEVLRHNLTVDFACEIMNDLMLYPDDETAEEHRKTKEQKERLSNRFPIGKLLSELNLGKPELEKKFRPTPPDFLWAAKVEEYMEKRNIHDFDALFGQIKSEIEKEVLNADDMGNDPSFQEEVSEVLHAKRDEIMDMGGGTKVCRNVLSGLSAQVIEMRKAYQAVSLEDANEKLNKRMDSINDFLTRNQGKLFFKKKALKRLNQTFPVLKSYVSKSLEYRLAQSVIPYLEEVEKLIESVLEDLQRDEKGFNRILEVIQNMELPYQSSNLLLNAVSPDLLFKFIRYYDYPSGSRPEDVAESVKKGGLDIHKKRLNKSVEAKNIPVSDFIDQRPEDVANAIFELAKAKIDNLGEDQWRKSFTKSGLYPVFGVDAANIRKKDEPKIDAYTITKESVNKNSFPYLEYQQTEGFEKSGQIFLIRPSLWEGDTDIEYQRWVEKEPWPEGDQRPVIGSASVSPYSLTSLQMHYGIPLYSIDEIEDWKSDYEYMLKNTDRPLHKFRTRMKEPYINIAKASDMTRSEISQVFDWAIRTSDEYLIFFMHDDLPMLDMLENDIVRTTYFRLFDEEYLELDKVKELLKKEESLTDYLFREIKLVNSQIKGNAPLDEYFAYHQGQDAARVVTRLLEKLADMDNLENTSIKFKKTSTSTGVFISPEGVVEDPMLKELLTRHFLKELPTPVLKEGLTEKFVKERLMNAPSFLECFLSKCSEAYEHLLMLGKSEGDFPVALREK